jgi:ribosomal protein S12 methylthiotransferase
MKSKRKVFLVSLGCAKNLVDSENMLGLLQGAGYRVVGDVEDAHVAVVNTCGFVQKAVEETIDTILGLADYRRKGVLERLVVAGCFVQRYGYKLRAEIPEVDGWLGTGEFPRILEILDAPESPAPPFLIGRPTYLADHTVPRTLTTPAHTAYLKIAEGCSHTCSYCTIPGLRGPFRSRTVQSLFQEAERMADTGVKEINLVAQDTTAYGMDLGLHLEDLLEKLVLVGGIEWIRILYSHPLRISDRLLGLIAEEEKLCPYLDVPLQHVNEEILRSMGRPFEAEGPGPLIERIRSKTRPISIRTTLMVGFPGETIARFQDLYDFVEWAEFDHLGVFVFSPERGTPAARLKERVDPGQALRRQDAIMGLQAGISREKNQRIVGKTLPVLVEGLSPETDLLLKGRTSAMAPDVDGQVLINRGKGVVGDIQQVTITEAHTYDLVGEIA